jgi:hypothetical protein
MTSLGWSFGQTVLTFLLTCLVSLNLTTTASAEIGDSKTLIEQQ